MSRITRHVGTYAVFVVIVAICSDPLARDLGGHLADHHDPWLFGWIMASNAHRIWHAPCELLHGNALYPFGSTITFSEPLLVPSALWGVIWLGSGNPVLAYNVTLLSLWALSGSTMFHCARALIGHAIPAFFAAVAFTVCAYHLSYHLEFQMQLTFGIPVAFLGWYRFLVTQSWRPLLVALTAVVVTTVSTIYYGVILTLALGVFTVEYALLRRRDWQWRTPLLAAVGSGCAAVAVAPLIRAYFRMAQELHVDRALHHQPLRHAADLLTYFESPPTFLYGLGVVTHAESHLFMGFAASVLALSSFAWLRRRQALEGAPVRQVRRGVWLAAGGGGLFGAIVLHDPRLPLLVPLALGAYVLFAEGSNAARDENRGRDLSTREWVMVLWLLAYVFFVLSLGRVVQWGGRNLGPGLYPYVYSLVPVLRGLRVLARFGVIVTFAVSLLAAFGMSWISQRVSGRVARIAILCVFFFVAAGDYGGAPFAYRREPSSPAASYLRFARDPEPYAILEVPFWADKQDTEYMFRSIVHWKYVVNGISGFVPKLTSRLGGLLKEKGEAFPSERLREVLRSIYPLRYIVVHSVRLPPGERAKWARLRDHPVDEIRFVDRVGAADLYELTPIVERKRRIDRIFSYDFARERPRLTLMVRGADCAEADAILSLNEEVLATPHLSEAWSSLSVDLPNTLRLVNWNRIQLSLAEGVQPGCRIEMRDFRLSSG